MWLLKRKSQICWSWCHWRRKLSRTSNFYLINGWKLTTNGQALFSFIGLIHFYDRYAPYFKICMKTFRKFLKQFYRNPIPLMAWTPALIELSNELKKWLTSSPVLVIFYPNEPTLLKTDWSAECMGRIHKYPAHAFCTPISLK